MKIADEIENDYGLELYWDYRDKLSEEQVFKIITEEDGYIDVESEIWDNSLHYIDEQIYNAIKEKIEEKGIWIRDFEGTDEYEELLSECEGRFDLKLNDGLRNSSIHLRVRLESNEDMISIADIKNSETFKEFKRVFRRKYKKDELNTEIGNAQDYGEFTFYFNVSGDEILKLREQILKGYIVLREGLYFGLFDCFNGGGSVLDMQLQKGITLNLKDWRVRNENERVVRGLKGKKEEDKYWKVGIYGDNLTKYGIDEVYGLAVWQEW